MKSVINIKVMVFSLMALMSIGMFTSCSNDDDNGSAPSDVFHPINASTRTLINLVEKNEYTYTEFREAIVNWPMLSYAGDAISALIKPALRLVYARRVT
jgi:DNA-binding cell septation regulator SpoVG